MVVLDTNIVSALMRDCPEPEVLAWLDKQLASTLFVTAVTEAEIRIGIAPLPRGRRRRGLTAAAEWAFGVLFVERILPFDSAAARAYVVIAAGRRAAGRPISQADCQPAAIACSRGALVATWGVDDCAGCGGEVMNPCRTGRKYEA